MALFRGGLATVVLKDREQIQHGPRFLIGWDVLKPGGRIQQQGAWIPRENVQDPDIVIEVSGSPIG